MEKEELEKLFASMKEWIASVDQKTSIAFVLEIGTFTLIIRPTVDLLVGGGLVYRLLRYYCLCRRS